MDGISQSLTSNFFEASNAPNKLDFLYGFRGWSSICVLLQHFTSEFQLRYTDFKLFTIIGLLGLTGFFTLSAFFLTYGLIVNFEKAKTNRMVLLRIVIFAIRRIFRVYFPFIAFWTVIYLIPDKWEALTLSRPQITYTEGLMLRKLEKSHLWTVSVEMRYYVYIPFISFVCAKSRRFWWLPLLFLIILGRTIEYYNILRCKERSSYFYLLPTFLNGSCIAIIYHFVPTRCERLYKTINTIPVQRVLVALLVIFTFATFRYSAVLYNWMYDHPIFKPSILTSSTLLLLLFTGPNIVKTFYNISSLRSMGRVSYGVYLFQYVVLGFLVQYKDDFEISMEPLLLTFLFCYLISFSWTHTVENAFMRVSKKLCARVTGSSYFKNCNGPEVNSQRQQPTNVIVD